jgi:hypothetical protein
VTGVFGVAGAGGATLDPAISCEMPHAINKKGIRNDAGFMEDLRTKPKSYPE